MINLNKNAEAILKSQRPEDIEGKETPKKQDHHKKAWYKKFEDLVNFQHAHGGRTDVKLRKKKLSYWVENQRKFYCQFFKDEHTPPKPERKSALENIGFVWTVKREVQVKVPSAGKTK